MQIGFGAPVSIIAGRRDWFLAFKDYKACPDVNEQLLWWMTDTVTEQTPDFEDYIPFGGWKIPFAKNYNGVAACGISVGTNYFQE